MALTRNPLVAPVVGYLTRLRFPVLLVIVGSLFAVDLVVPDVVPLLDEVLLGLATALFASWRRRKDPSTIDVEP